MSNSTPSIPKIYWIISGLALLWYLFGLSVYYMSVSTSPETYKEWLDSGQYSAGYIEYMQTVPSWTWSAFAIATTSGVLACICLLLRRSWAVPLFIVSLIGSLVLYAYAYILSGKAGELPTSDYVVSALVVAVSSFMIWFSRKKKAKGILR
jgi:hypothetical protein